MYSEVFPSRLKHARKLNAMTQYEVADLLGITQPTYGSYERGISEPSLEKLALLAKLFEVTSDWLIGLSSDNSDIVRIIQERERNNLLKKLEREAELKNRLLGGR